MTFLNVPGTINAPPLSDGIWSLDASPMRSPHRHCHHHTRHTWALSPALLTLIILLIFLIAPVSVTGNHATPKPSAKDAKPAPLQAGVNPYRQSLVAPVTGSAGWRVARGKVADIGYHPGQARLGPEGPKVLAGLSGLVSEKPTITLREKATVKHTKVVPIAKYQSLVDALKEADTQKKGRR